MLMSSRSRIFRSSSSIISSSISSSSICSSILEHVSVVIAIIIYFMSIRLSSVKETLQFKLLHQLKTRLHGFPKLPSAVQEPTVFSFP